MMDLNTLPPEAFELILSLSLSLFFILLIDPNSSKDLPDRRLALNQSFQVQLFHKPKAPQYVSLCFFHVQHQCFGHGNFLLRKTCFNLRMVEPSLSRLPYVIQGTHRGHIGVEVDVHKAVSGTSPWLQAEGANVCNVHLSKMSPANFQAKIKSWFQNKRLMKPIEWIWMFCRDFPVFWNLLDLCSGISNFTNDLTLGQSLEAPNFLNAATSTSKPQLVRWFTWTEPSTCKKLAKLSISKGSTGEFVHWCDEITWTRESEAPSQGLQDGGNVTTVLVRAAPAMEKYVNACNYSKHLLDVDWKWLNYLMTMIMTTIMIMVVQWHMIRITKVEWTLNQEGLDQDPLFNTWHKNEWNCNRHIWDYLSVLVDSWNKLSFCWDMLRFFESVSYLLRGFTTKWILHAILWDVFGCRLQQRIQNLGLTVPVIIWKSLNDIFELFCQNLRSGRRTNSRGKNLMILWEIRHNEHTNNRTQLL